MRPVRPTLDFSAKSGFSTAYAELTQRPIFSAKPAALSGLSRIPSNPRKLPECLCLIPLLGPTARTRWTKLLMLGNPFGEYPSPSAQHLKT